MKFNELYGKDSKGGLKLWTVKTDGSVITVTHGKLGGKLQSKETITEGKNIGKANETTPEQQAEIEAEAKWIKQKKSGYFETQEEALAFVEFSPMKCQNYNDFSHKIAYPCYLQPKLNGLRCMVDSDGNAWSKAGEVYKLPAHIQSEINRLAEEGLIPDGVDGEIYAGLESEGGLSLQQIVSAFRKPNENTPKLSLWIYDYPSRTAGAIERINQYLVTEVDSREWRENIVFVPIHFVENEEQGNILYDHYVKLGFEGVVYRNLDGLYEHGKRSYDVQKRKPRLDTEARVLSVEEDKNNQGILLCELENGVQFKCLMLKGADENINYRHYENALKLIGQFITFEYEELSDSGVPTKPVGAKIRNVQVAADGSWLVKE